MTARFAAAAICLAAVAAIVACAGVRVRDCHLQVSSHQRLVKPTTPKRRSRVPDRTTMATVNCPVN